jgi:hypothetical protein
MVKRMWAGMTDPAGYLALQNQAMRAHPLPMLVLALWVHWLKKNNSEL